MGDAVEIRCAVEVREDATRMSPGRLTGTLLTYGERANDRPERFERGSLRWPDEGIVVREQHNREAPIVRVKPVLQGDRIVVDQALPDTQRGRDAAVSIREGLLTGLSVEVVVESERYEGELRTVQRARLVGAGLVDDASYSGSTVEVRHRGRRRLLWPSV